MISKLSYMIADFLYKKSAITEDEKDVYIYGYEMLIDGVIDTVVLLIFGMLTKTIIATIWFIGIFTFTRTYCGGLHASTRIRCIMLTFCSWLAVTRMSSIDMQFINIYVCSGLLVTWLIFMLYAPIESYSKPLTEAEKASNRKKSIVILFIQTVIASLCLSCGMMMSAIAITSTLIIISVLMIITKFNKEEKLYD